VKRKTKKPKTYGSSETQVTQERTITLILEATPLFRIPTIQRAVWWIGVPGNALGGGRGKGGEGRRDPRPTHTPTPTHAHRAAGSGTAEGGSRGHNPIRRRETGGIGAVPGIGRDRRVPQLPQAPMVVGHSVPDLHPSAVTSQMVGEGTGVSTSGNKGSAALQ